MSTDPEPEPEPESEAPPLDISPILPEKYSGIFRTRWCDGDTSDQVDQEFKVTLKIDEIKFDPTFDPMLKGIPASVQVFHEDCLAYYIDPDEEDPDNKEALDKLVDQLAFDFVKFRTLSFDYTYIGMSFIKPVAVLDVIEFVYDVDDPVYDKSETIELVEDKKRPNCYTRIKSEPWSGYPEWFQHWDKEGFPEDCDESKDRTPGILMLVPDSLHGGGGPTGGGGTTTGTSVLTLEDGRLVLDYDKSLPFPCGCKAPCGQVCVTVTGPGNLIGITITAKTQPIDHVNITNGGAGYTKAPVVIFNSANGRGGVGIAVLDDNGHVSSVTIVEPGAYTGPVTIAFNNAGTGATTGAVGNVVLGTEYEVNTCVTDGVVTGINVSNAGSKYTSVPTVTIVGGGGSGVEVKVAMTLENPVTVVFGGTGYVVGQTYNILGGTPNGPNIATVRVTAIGAGGAITAATAQNGGSYAELPPNPVSIQPGTLGTSALCNVTWRIGGIELINGGTGFTSAPTVTFSPPGTTGGVTALGTASFAFKCCLGVFISGFYRISTNGCNPGTLPIANVLCPTNTNVTIALSGKASVKFNPCGACNAVGSLGGHPTSIKMTGFGISTTVPVVVAPGATCILVFGIARPGKYTFELLDGDCYYPEVHSDVNVADCLESPVDLTINGQPKSYDQTMYVKGCGLPLAGATVTISGSKYSASSVTDDNGKVVFTSIPADCDFTRTVTYPRFETIGPNPWRSPCVSDETATNTFNFQTPISGYHCVKCVAYPLPETMFGTDSEGAFTLIYRGPTLGWMGCHEVGGKALVCLRGGDDCTAKFTPEGDQTLFYLGPNAAISWSFGGNNGVCGMSSAIPGAIDIWEDGIGTGTRYWPISGCCHPVSTDHSGVGWHDDLHCTDGLPVNESICHPGFPGLGCGSGKDTVLLTVYPSIPPFGAEYSILPEIGHDPILWPIGLVAISE